ncbi:hypothetical protein EI555_018698, partial [Monodon monoceros]
ARSPGVTKGGNLRDELDSNKLALSLSDLNEVPATILDPSCNKLTTLPSDFHGLAHLVKLDMSKNKLRQLPAGFGLLVNLRHLDLLNSRLVTLPVSFAQLRSLKWLGLNDNPLDPVLLGREAAVLEHTKAVQLDQEREGQRQLAIDREAEKTWEAKQRAKEAPERNCGSGRRRKRRSAGERSRTPSKQPTRSRRNLRRKQIKPRNLSPALGPGRPRGSHTRSWAVLGLPLPLLLRVAGGLVACRVTELQQQPVCTSVNTIYDNALRRCAATASSGGSCRPILSRELVLHAC